MDNSFLSSLASSLAGNSDKADLLVEKYHYWNSENRIERFYNNLIGYLDENAIATEEYEDGYITASAVLCQYDDLKTGNVYRLSRKFNPLNGLAYARLFELSQTLGTFRIEEPCARKTVVVNGYEWEYAEFLPPNRQNGSSVMSMSAQTTNVKDAVIEMTDHIIGAVRAAKQVSQELGCGVPMELCAIVSLYRDDVGLYMSDVYEWSTPLSTVLAFGASQITTSVYGMHKIGIITDDEKHELISMMRQKWQTI